MIHRPRRPPLLLGPLERFLFRLSGVDPSSGTATVTVQIHDNGGTANGGVDTSAVQTFLITVNAVNDAPTNSVPAAQVTSEDTALLAALTLTSYVFAYTPLKTRTSASTAIGAIPGAMPRRPRWCGSTSPTPRATCTSCRA